MHSASTCFPQLPSKGYKADGQRCLKLRRRVSKERGSKAATQTRAKAKKRKMVWKEEASWELG